MTYGEQQTWDRQVKSASKIQTPAPIATENPNCRSIIVNGSFDWIKMKHLSVKIIFHQFFIDTMYNLVQVWRMSLFQRVTSVSISNTYTKWEWFEKRAMNCSVHNRLRFKIFCSIVYFRSSSNKIELILMLLKTRWKCWFTQYLNYKITQALIDSVLFFDKVRC